MPVKPFVATSPVLPTPTAMDNDVETARVDVVAAHQRVVRRWIAGSVTKQEVETNISSSDIGDMKVVQADGYSVVFC